MAIRRVEIGASVLVAAVENVRAQNSVGNHVHKHANYKIIGCQLEVSELRV